VAFAEDVGCAEGPRGDEHTRSVWDALPLLARSCMHAHVGVLGLGCALASVYLYGHECAHTGAQESMHTHEPLQTSVHASADSCAFTCTHTQDTHMCAQKQVTPAHTHAHLAAVGGHGHGGKPGVPRGAAVLDMLLTPCCCAGPQILVLAARWGEVDACLGRTAGSSTAAVPLLGVLRARVGWRAARAIGALLVGPTACERVAAAAANDDAHIRLWVALLWLRCLLTLALHDTCYLLALALHDACLRLACVSGVAAIPLMSARRPGNPSANPCLHIEQGADDGHAGGRRAAGVSHVHERVAPLADVAHIVEGCTITVSQACRSHDGRLLAERVCGVPMIRRTISPWSLNRDGEDAACQASNSRVGRACLGHQRLEQGIRL